MLGFVGRPAAAQPVVAETPLQSPQPTAAEAVPQEPVPQDLAETPLSEMLQLHGYGNWRSGITDGDNEYLYGAERGRFDSASFTLVLHATPFKFLRLVAAQEVGIDGLGEELEVELDYVFADLTVSDWLDLIVGVGPFPSGVFTEIYDVGTLRPFLALPQGIYGFNGALGENLMGIQVRFHAPLGSVAGIELLLFGGAAQFESKLPFLVYELESDASAAELEALDEDETEGLSHLVGARAVLQTPLEGLALGVSGYIGDSDEENELRPEAEDELHAVVTGFATFIDEPITLRLEYLYGALEGAQLHAAYLEATYELTAEWHIALRGDLARFELPEDPRGAESLTEHLDFAFGLSYWIGSDFTVQAAYHFVLGNLYAHPEGEALFEAVQDDALEKRTHYAELGMAFSF